MPRRILGKCRGIVYHVLNRGVGRMRLFRKAADFAAMETVLADALKRRRCACWRIACSQSLAPAALAAGRWRLSEFMRWLTLTHTQRWHANRPRQEGAIYQGRFKSFPVQSDEHLLAVARYIERNPLRAGMVSMWSNGSGRACGVAARRIRRSAKSLATGRCRVEGLVEVGAATANRGRTGGRPPQRSAGPAVWRGPLGPPRCQAIRP